MVLIKSISGIRGTIGGSVGDSLTPVDIVRFTAAFGSWIKTKTNSETVTIILGRDARVSGSMLQKLSSATLQALGVNVLDLGLSTTPTVELAVMMEKADAGIVLTASHNPKEWNALKLLNNKGEFISAEDGLEVLEIAKNERYSFVNVDLLGEYYVDDSYIEKHILSIMKLPLVDVTAIRNAGFKIVVDAVNSTGGIAVPLLLSKLGVECVKLYCEPDGNFPHDPEPLAKNLKDISSLVLEESADLGIVVDPDVDRLSFINEDGSMFGEEYTIVAVADYVLSKVIGSTVSNLSSSRALQDLTKKYNANYYSSAVGEVNVVSKMKEVGAVIGGEGNGGVIYPELHYGRDSLVGIALFLTHLANKKIKCTELRSSYSSYFMSKEKIKLESSANINFLFLQMQDKYSNENISTIDGLKIDFDTEWVHLRRSNTEPIIRVYAESTSLDQAHFLSSRFVKEIKEMIS